jgi:hypothetical protein
LAISPKFIISVVSVAKSKNIAAFAFTCVLESFALFMAISAWIYIVLTAMKRGDEVLNASLLQFLSSVKYFIGSMLQFSIKRFIAVTSYEKTSFNASSPLLLKRNSSLNASSPLLFKVTLPTSGNLI